MKGYVIVNTNSGWFYNGMNQWKKDIRDAKLYHTEKGAKETADYKYKAKDVEIRTVEINLV